MGWGTVQLLGQEEGARGEPWAGGVSVTAQEGAGCLEPSLR